MVLSRWVEFNVYTISIKYESSFIAVYIDHRVNIVGVKQDLHVRIINVFQHLKYTTKI